MVAAAAVVACLVWLELLVETTHLAQAVTEQAIQYPALRHFIRAVVPELVILMGYQLEAPAVVVRALEVRLLLRLQEAPLIQVVVEVVDQLMWAVRAAPVLSSSATP